MCYHYCIFSVHCEERWRGKDRVTERKRLVRYGYTQTPVKVTWVSYESIFAPKAARTFTHMTGTSAHCILLIRDQIRDAYFRSEMLLHSFFKRSRKNTRVRTACGLIFALFPVSFLTLSYMSVSEPRSDPVGTVPRPNWLKLWKTPLAQEAAVAWNKHTLPVQGRHTSTHKH